MDAAESALRAGYRLDRYELLCPIASGGMATVWLARLRGKRGFEKLFAVKTIRTELVDDPRFQEMFLDEARIASGIQHPNVAQILDLGEQDDVLFIVMEWVDGDSLAKVRKLVTKRGHSLPVGVVLRVLADACAGLHAAHEIRDERGELLEIVHRDVSLHNILVGSAGSVKVIDFGIAKAHNRMQGETRTGVVKGKVHYMAPEQVQKARGVDRRVDVWALGVCLHELVTGKLPYDGDDDVEVIRKLMAGEAPPLAGALPDSVERVLERSLVLDVDSRFPTAAAMQRALEVAMNEMGESTTSEDVAAFLRSELPELAQMRKGIVAKAVDEARDRAASSGETQIAEPDAAFAPTVMSDRRAAPNERDGESLTLPKTRRAWLWIALLVLAGGGVAATRWPAEVRGWLAPPLSASAAEPPLPSASEAQPTPSSPASASVIPPRLEASARHHRWPIGRDPPAPAVAAVPSVSAPALVPTSPWSPYKTVPSAAASEEPPTGAAPP